MTFALARGFVEVHRMHGMGLDARNFAYTQWQGLGATLQAHGFVATTYQAEAEANDQPVEKLAELHMHAKQGWLSPDPTWPDSATMDSMQAVFRNIVAPQHVSAA